MLNPSMRAANYASYLGIKGAQGMLGGKASGLAGLTMQVLCQRWFADYPDGEGMLYNSFKSDVTATKSPFYNSSELTTW